MSIISSTTSVSRFSEISLRESS